jgi:hypothetical protein
MNYQITLDNYSDTLYYTPMLNGGKTMKGAGQKLYELYRSTPPARDHKSSHSCAYWHGYDGIEFKHVRGSYGWWAYKAGKDARKAERPKLYDADGKVHKVTVPED